MSTSTALTININPYNPMRKPLIAAVALMLAAAQALADEKSFASPDGRLVVTVDDADGRPAYRVALDGQTCLERSPLGLYTNYADLSQQLTMTGCDVRTVTDDYTLATWKQSHVHYEATEAVCHFSREQKPALDVIFRVTGRDVAFRYLLPVQGSTLVAVIRGEATGFALPQGTTTFLCPQSKPMGGFASTSPSYETSYATDEPAGRNGWGEGYTFPCLFKAPHGADGHAWLLISETGTDGGYVGCRLLCEQNGSSPSTLYKIGFPQQGEMNGQGTTTAAVSLPALTPWRTITLGTTLAPIVESTVANDLVQPKYTASKAYTYGKGSWSWIIAMDASCNYDDQKRYIDFSAAMGYRSVLVDALWDTQIGRDRMAELSAYARSKGVGLFLWYNSNGSWNNAPQGPRHCMDRPAARRREMAWMQQIGILGIKVDFFGGDKQPMMQLYEDILTDANDFGLQVIFHGCTLPRGWERMYPNFVASEAVLASENLHFGQGACDAEARNACLLPFIRNAVASMDFGGSALNKRYSADNQRGTTRRTSDVFALATAVLFQSSVQHFALAPNNLDDAPQWAMQFMKDVPTQWDEVRFIDGYPGRYILLARRSGTRWFVVGISAADVKDKRGRTQPLTLQLDLSPFFAKGTAVTTYTDDAQLAGTCRQLTLKKTTMKVTIPENGAFVITGNE